VKFDYFANDKFKVLQCMAERQIPVKGSMIIKLSQQEIAEILNFSKVKVNGIINELKVDGYLIQKSSRGKYTLTVKAVDILSEMQ
jgi:DNA-binding IclR family transcriptional regulator